MSDDTKTSGTVRFDLPAVADIRLADEIVTRCREAVGASGDVEIGCDSVERIDAAVLQCLVALAQSLDQARRQLTITNPTPAFARAAEILGLTEILDRQLVASP